MLGLLRTSLGIARRAAPALPATVRNAKLASIPCVPQDWMFRFFPYLTRDKVRYFIRFNQVSFAMGLGFALLVCHTPFVGDNYDHMWHSPLYEYKKRQLENTGQLEENLRVKVHHFYPQEA